MTTDELRQLLAQLGIEWDVQPTVFYVFYQRPDGTINNLSINIQNMKHPHDTGGQVLENAEQLMANYPDMRQATIVGYDHPDEGPTAWIDTAEACALLHIHRNTLHLWCKQGWLRAHKVGGKIYYDRAQIDKMIASGALQDNGRLDRTGL